MQKTPWWLVGCGLALILFVSLACVGILGAAWALNVGGGGGPSIESSTAAALIGAAQAEDPTAEISSAFVMCSRANWTCSWDPDLEGENIPQSVADRILAEVDHSRITAEGVFTLECVTDYADEVPGSYYKCTWDPGTGEEALGVR
ncbi:MAG: hypothetical protein JNL73_05410 [Anaerolineales bacterium]|nr:hypothetical protein [Anaerolineales bacterium]